MQRLLFALLLLLGPLAFFPGVLTGEVISADDHLSVHPAFQEAPGGRVRHPALSDPAVQFSGLRAEAVRQLSEGHVPLWNPQLYGGAPLLGDGQSRVGWPGTWLRLALPEDIAQNLEAIGVMTSLGLGVMFLLRALGLSLGAATVGGCAALGLPYLQVWLLHPHASTYMAWPWLLLGLERLRVGRGPWALVLAVMGLGVGGHPETAAHGLLVGVAWAALRLRGLRGRALGWALAGALCGGLLTAWVWGPLLDQVLRSATAQAHGGNTLHPAQLLDLLWPSFLGHPAGEGYRGPAPWASGALHPGLVSLGLAGLSLRGAASGEAAPSAGQPGRWLWGAWALGLLAALTMSWGPVNNARLGSEAALFLAMAAGFGAERLLRGRAWGWGVALGLLTLAGGVHARRLDQGTLPAAQHAPEPAAWTKALAERAEDGRVQGLGWVLQPNTGALAGLRDLRGYDLPVSMDTERLMAALNPQLRRPWFPVEYVDRPVERLLTFAAVRFLVSEGPLAGRQALDLGPSPVYVYALDADAPRAWVASSAWSAADAEASLRCVTRGRCNRGRPPVEGEGLEGPARLERVDVEERGPARVIKLPEREAPGLLVNAEAWAPGWTAEVDGAPRPVLRVAGAFQGVRVAPGERVVRLSYRPRGWTWGLWGTGAGVLGVLGLVVGWRRGGA